MKKSQRQKRREKYKKPQLTKKEITKKVPQKTFYDKNYKKLIIIPALLLLIAILLITMKIINTGEFINKGITLSGGVSVTVIKENINKETLLQDLEQEFPEYQINIRGIDDSGRRIGVLIETNLPPENKEEANKFNELIKQKTNASNQDISTETIGSSLGDAFFKQTLIAVILAFIFMGAVIFMYFKLVVPSALTILSALSDIIITLAVVNVLGINIGTAGIAAFLMLIGYSVDANIVLNMRVIKRTTGTIPEQIKSAFSTGLTMSVTTLIAITVAFIIVDSPVLKEIMLILIIGLIVDVLNTWIQNAGLLRWYLEKKEQKN
ncbi:protein translocase subunit SecF [Candidatus Woesearchaeota archaeon]|jgi:preprotein translocase subunit SecF|nr:protein translocase subunit SecF [Candidatus Woesearchaeota archaeon]